jgi:predicted alpha/beta-fold hydrolase
MPIVQNSRFKPAWWLRNAHLQTFWPALLRRPPAPPTWRERLATPDGDFIELDWCGKAAEAPGIPIVMLLHGMTGSSRSSYILGMQAALSRLGWRSVAMNFRGCSGQPNQTARCYHSGDTEDVGLLYHTLRRSYPRSPLAAVGYSLGGNVVLKWLGEQGSGLGLFAAAAVSVPLVLNHCSERLDRGFSKVYRNQLLRELKDYIYGKQAHLRRIGRLDEWEKLARVGDLSAIRSFWEYDNRIATRLYGFEDAWDFYRQASSRPYLKSIRTPTLVIHSRDDPFMTPAVLPAEEELSPSVELEITQGGGHVGFLAGRWPGRPRYWLEQRIPAFLEGRLRGD